jgi:hypothetical protein
MDEAEGVERVTLIPNDQTAEVAQPSEETLERPTAFVAAQRTPILGLGTDTATAMGRNQLNAQIQQRRIQGIGIVGAVADESLGQLVYEPRGEGGGDEGHRVRRSRGGTRGERKTSTVCQSRHCHALRTCAPLGFSHTPAPSYIMRKGIQLLYAGR